MDWRSPLDLIPFLERRRYRRAWSSFYRAPGSPAFPNEVADLLTRQLPPCLGWRVAVVERVFVLEVLADCNVEEWFDAWWTAEVSECLMLHVWDHEGPLLTDNILDWDYPDFWTLSELLDEPLEESEDVLMGWQTDPEAWKGE